MTYPSTYEGFGNAFLEAVYFRRPVACNRYSIYRTDIEPSGFQTISFDGYLTDDVVEHAGRALEDQDYRDAMTSRNYEVAQRFFSYDVLERARRGVAVASSTRRSCFPVLLRNESFALRPQREMPLPQV